MEARYRARRSCPVAASADASSHSASAYCVAAATRGESPRDARSSANDDASFERRSLFGSGLSSTLGPVVAAGSFFSVALFHSLPGAPMARLASSGSPVPIATPAASALATASLSVRMSARFSPGAIVASRNTSARDAGTGAKAPSQYIHVRAMDRNSTYLCAPEATSASTSGSDAHVASFAPAARSKMNRFGARARSPPGAIEPRELEKREAGPNTRAGAPRAGRRISPGEGEEGGGGGDGDGGVAGVGGRRQPNVEDPSAPVSGARTPHSPPYASQGSRCNTDLPAFAADLRVKDRWGEGGWGERGVSA